MDLIVDEATGREVPSFPEDNSDELVDSLICVGI